MNFNCCYLRIMFSKFFKKKERRDIQSEPSLRSNGIECKPIIYYSTDKGKYITANVPIKMSIQTKSAYKNVNYTKVNDKVDELDKIYDLYTRDDDISEDDINEDDINEDDVNVIKDDDINYARDRYTIEKKDDQSDIDDKDRFSLDTDIYEMVYSGSYSRNLDYISNHYRYDIQHDVYYYKTRPDSYYSDIIGINDK